MAGENHDYPKYWALEKFSVDMIKGVLRRVLTEEKSNSIKEI